MHSDSDAVDAHEREMLEHLHRALLDSQHRFERAVTITDVLLTGSYPLTEAEFRFRSDRHPGREQKWLGRLWTDEGDVQTWGRRLSLAATLPDAEWHARELIHGFNDNWTDSNGSVTEG